MSTFFQNLGQGPARMAAPPALAVSCWVHALITPSLNFLLVKRTGQCSPHKEVSEIIHWAGLAHSKCWINISSSYDYKWYHRHSYPYILRDSIRIKMTLFILLPWSIVGDLGLGLNSADRCFTWSPSQTKLHVCEGQAQR